MEAENRMLTAAGGRRQPKWEFSDDDESDSSISSMNSASSDDDDDASSSSSSPSSPTGPLYELSSLMTHLPLKRGLSKFYQGKSQSFTSLASVNNIEDVAKKVNDACKMRVKSWKRHGSMAPKADIAKKSSRGTQFFSSSKRPNTTTISLRTNC